MSNATEPLDPTLIAAFAAGDRGAGEALLRRHLGAVRAYLAARCRDADLAEELTQEVAARVSLAASRLSPGDNLKGYLVRTAQNAWRDWLRRELVRRRAADTLRTEARATTAPADARLMERELQEALGRAIDSLPRAQRDVVALRHREDLTFAEIAARLHRPLGTVLTQMRAALQRMHQAMEAYR